MDVALLIRQRLQKLNLEQKDLAAAAEVTESYISQLLTRRKLPPAPGRTDIYEKIGDILQLPSEELAKLATIQRREGLIKKGGATTQPLFSQFREWALRKCAPERRPQISQIFGKEPFGELERLIAQTLLDVAQSVAKAELRNEEWQRKLAPLSGQSYKQTRVKMLDFLDTDVFSVSVEGCIAFLDPIIDAWDIELASFSIEVNLNPLLVARSWRRFEFSEQAPFEPISMEPGLEQFLNDPLLGGDATEEEIKFLKGLTFGNRRPLALYYYRELQNLRDPLHFSCPARVKLKS